MTAKPEPKSTFVKVRCEECKNEQIIFSNASTKVKCLVCDEKIAEPTGGHTDIQASILEVLQ